MTQRWARASQALLARIVGVRGRVDGLRFPVFTRKYLGAFDYCIGVWHGRLDDRGGRKWRWCIS